MTPEYIIEICVAIDIAILGIAYPIIVDKISNIGDKYSSEYIAVLFNYEFPQRTLKLTIRKRQFEISIFKLAIYLTILSFLFLIFPFPPPAAWDKWFVNNSAKLIVLSFTILLTVFFFIWLNKVNLYNGRSKLLLRHIVAAYGKLKDDTEIKSYHLKAINELTFYAVEKQDEHLQETLLEFYHSVFYKIRKNHDKTKPLVYPIDLYFLINKLNTELLSNQNRKLLAIEDRAVSGIWLLGEDFEEIAISDETYNWLWRNLYVVCDNERFVKMYWAYASQYFDYHLKRIDPIYSGAELKNRDEIERRKEERRIFLEFHYAFGGLLLYRGQFKALKYIFEYSQSLPPKYVLLPDSMTAVFNWFENFRNEFKNRKTPIDLKYYFPELDNLGNRRQVNYWICRYLSVLFIRQYSLNTYYTYQDFTGLPQLPDNVIELNNWLDSVSYFERCLTDTLQNEDLLDDLGFAEVVEKNKDDFSEFIKKLKAEIINKIGEQKKDAPLSDNKVLLFKQKTNEIISGAFSEYNSVFNPITGYLPDNDLKLSINGSVTIMTKSAFTDNDITHLNYDSIFASQISINSIKRYIPNSFITASTDRYLLDKTKLLLGLDRIIAGRQDIVIVGVNVGYEIKEIINQSNYKDQIKYIPSTEHSVQNALYVLKRTDLPIIEHKALKADEISDLQLNEPINNALKLYASVIDINKAENKALKDKYLDTEENNLDLKILLSIAFLSIIHWKQNREVIQISIVSQYKEQGIKSDINEIKPLKNDES